MRLSHSVFRGFCLSWLACAPQTGGQTIPAADAMANYATNASAALTGSAIPAGPELYVGRKAYYSNPNSNHLLHDVVPFQLPDLGPGTFTDVRVAFRAQGDGTWNIPINLWAIPGSRATSATQGGDVRSATLNHTQFGSLIMPGFFHRRTVRDSFSQTPVWGAEASPLAAWLNGMLGGWNAATPSTFSFHSPGRFGKASPPCLGGPASSLHSRRAECILKIHSFSGLRPATAGQCLRRRPTPFPTPTPI